MGPNKARLFSQLNHFDERRFDVMALQGSAVHLR